ncbi:Thioredoxin domain-containing protein [Heracleum sosnowskyi]|uniref:Thioredoxin domain-containing protein n=1 Tax=Heracleum sosnowskyi TaxID=360622 RepID=A0AAD8N7M8_9APIA|nr:Thioredoxin domain-containing protein [Heracleum sosnowskyi]
MNCLGSSSSVRPSDRHLFYRAVFGSKTNSLFLSLAHCCVQLPGYNFLYSMGGCLTKTFKKSVQKVPTQRLGGQDVTTITTINQWEEKLSESKRDNKIMVVSFGASWCGPCKAILPVFTELADKYPSLMFLTVDVDGLAEFSTSWDIKATPTFFFLKNGREVDKLVGANKEELQRKIYSPLFGNEEKALDSTN